MKTELKTETMMPQNANDVKKLKEKIEKREEAREIKTKEKTATVSAQARACVREEAAADPSGPDAKSAAAAKREKDELIRENYRLETELRRAQRCLHVWYVALRKHKEEIAVLRREADELRRNAAFERRTRCDATPAFNGAGEKPVGTMRRIEEAWSEFFGEMSELATACKLFADKFNAMRTVETEGGAK